MSQDNHDKKTIDKKGMDLWKLKQEEKKRKQEQEQAQGADKKDKKDKKDKDKKEKKSKKQEAVQAPQPRLQPKEEKVMEEEELPFHSLTSVKERLEERDHQAQETLILKYMDQLISVQDVILYVGEQGWRPQCQQVHVPGFNKCKSAEIVCHFQDLTYLMEGTLTKFFIQAQIFFGNGSILAPRGALTMVLLADYYRIPVVVCGGSWNYNGWSPLSQASLIDKYGAKCLEKSDFVDVKYLSTAVLEVGTVSPGQVSGYPPLVYKELQKKTIDW